ncbi:hypothetical protein WMY93_009827 [Mugilogobius chulae]|uniref:Fibronectin type-III domain-containing protein n=1 Tax=Mugilogobius chulae TaxID=88201 RepID=A0AAW0PHZ1_9GOBI
MWNGRTQRDPPLFVPDIRTRRFSSVESREAHLSSLVHEAERRATELAAQAQREGLSLDACHNNKALRSWEWRSRLYARMKTGFQHARPPEAPTMVRLSVSSSTSLNVSFQEPHSLNNTVVTKYKVEWSCVKDFSLLAGETVLDNLQSLKFSIQDSQRECNFALTWHKHLSCFLFKLLLLCVFQGQVYFVRVSAYNMKGWGPAAASLPPSAAPSNWRESDGRESKRRGQIDAMEKLLQQVRETHTLFCSGVVVYVGGRSVARQSLSVSMSSSSTLQTRHKMLTAAAHMQNLLGTHNLGRVHYEPIKDRHGNVLLITVRELDSQSSAFNGKWTAVTKLQSQRKSLSTPEEPYALDVLIITMQDILSYQRRSSYRLSPGLYLGYLKLSSSVDQIRVLVSQRNPNMLCHARVRDNNNVNREEWQWIQSLSSSDSALIGGEAQEAGLTAQSHTLCSTTSFRRR